MNKKHKLNGKAKKWINTRFARPEINRAFLRKIMVAQIAAATGSQISMIRGSTQGSQEQKALAIAKAIIARNEAIIRVHNQRGF